MPLRSDGNIETPPRTADSQKFIFSISVKSSILTPVFNNVAFQLSPKKRKTIKKLKKNKNKNENHINKKDFIYLQYHSNGLDRCRRFRKLIIYKLQTHPLRGIHQSSDTYLSSLQSFLFAYFPTLDMRADRLPLKYNDHLMRCENFLD